jgi:catechol 2,3-dioxygenase
MDVATYPAVRFKPRRFAHINMWVSDIDQSLKFYSETCGIGVQATEPGLKAGFLTNGNTHHDMGLVEITRGRARLGRDGQVQVPATMGVKPGLFHIGWEMENEAVLVDAIRRFSAAELPYDSTVDHQVSRSIYLPDPDGNLNEFYADAMKEWHGWFKGELELITGVWNPGDTPPTSDVRYDPDPVLTAVERAPVHPLRITHAALATHDAGRLRAFYEQVAGLETTYISTDGKAVCMRGTAAGFDLGICQVPADRPIGVHHFGFVLADEVAAAKAEAALTRAGRKPPISVDNANKRAFFILSPDKAWVEFGVERGGGHAPLEADDAAMRPFLV